jgi:hypothetical protein
MSTGHFINGRSVPKSRPTIFWEQRKYDCSFDYEEFLSKKDEKDLKH